jgi:hypothetical protein
MVPKKRLTKPKMSNVELMFRSHDPLEEQNRAERAQEDDYFRKLDQKLIEALREKNAAEIEQAIRTYTRMRCPKCDESLETMLGREGTIDVCPGCDGVWLDKEKWEVLVGLKASGWLPHLVKSLMGVKP